MHNVSLATLERLKELNRAQVALAARQAALPLSTAVARPPPRPADHAGMGWPTRWRWTTPPTLTPQRQCFAGTSAADLLGPARREAAALAARDLAKMRIEGRGGRGEGGGGGALSIAAEAVRAPRLRRGARTDGHEVALSGVQRWGAGVL